MSDTTWSEVSVGRLCTDIIDCVNKTAPLAEGVTPYKMLRTTNVRGGWVDTTNVRYVDKPVFDRWTRRKRLKPGDVIMTREAPLGDVGLLRDARNVFLGQRLVMYRADPAVCDNRFLLYAMLGPKVQSEIASLGAGATVEHLRVPDCEKLTIPCPPMAVQRRIGAILGAMDDLIENNRRRVVLLEQMAREVYREWFVRFRYPGHESVPLVDSPLGPIPAGWKPGTVADLCVESKTTLAPSQVHPDTPLVGLENIPRGQITLNDWGAAGGAGSRKTVFDEGDILFGRIRPYFHKVSLAPTSGVCSTDVIVLRPSNTYWGLAVFVTTSDEFVLMATQTSNGTKMPRAQWNVIRRFPVMVPSIEISRRFTNVVRPMLDEARALMLQSKELAQLRDLLLPKLVTGQIDLSVTN